MQDSRIKVLARQVIKFSVSLKEGEKILIDIIDGAEDFALALVDAVYEVGGLPFVTLQTNRINRAIMLGSTEEVWSNWYEYQAVRMKDMDAYVVVRRNDNPAELSDVPPNKLDIYNRYYGKLHFGIRLPETKWCVLRYPNSAMAQAAGMSLESFEDYYFKTCCIDYAKMNAAVAPLADLISKTDQVRIVAPGTDITFSVKGLCDKTPKCGVFNVPCGEIGMPVITDSVNGKIAYNMPSLFQGFVYQNIKFRFEKGIIVEADSNNIERMNKALDTDENARKIGEFALGFNPFVTRPILDTLFDEKMAKSLHFTPGNSRINPSGIHWDIVQSHDAKNGGGEIYFDGVLVRKDGLFVLKELEQINPENLIQYIALE
jgi:aminopeptidase